MKYKLIKEYPGSQPLGSVVIKESNIGSYYIDEFTKQKVNHFSLVEEFPEFWQKVEEVDYEILSFYCKDDSSSVFKICENKMYTSFYLFSRGTIEKQELLDSDEWDIQSVKRLSDGEVFTIGDNINYDHYSNFNKITKIYLTQKGNIKEGIWMDYAGGSCHISIAKKIPAKTPLFTTEDGVEIFDKNQKVFSVSECDFKIQNHQDSAWVKTRNPERKYHHFSTYKKAAEWILFNQKLLSLNDLLSTWRNAEYPKHTPLFRRFEELAKSKL